MKGKRFLALKQAEAQEKLAEAQQDQAEYQQSLDARLAQIEDNIQLIMAALKIGDADEDEKPDAKTDGDEKADSKKKSSSKK